MDVIYQGTTWSRQVTITDDADPPEPVDPTDLAAVLVIPDNDRCRCLWWWTPDTTTVALTITRTTPEQPGVYVVTLPAEGATDADVGTEDLPAQLQTRWEMIGLVGSDVVPIVNADVVVQPRSARPSMLEAAP